MDDLQMDGLCFFTLGLKPQMPAPQAEIPISAPNLELTNIAPVP